MKRALKPFSPIMMTKSDTIENKSFNHIKPLSKIGIASAVLFAIALSSCIHDKGNSDYLSVDQILPVTIEELEAKYDVYQGSRLRIVPVFTAIDDENKYDYTWYTMTTQGNKTVLSSEKALDAIIALPQDEYALHFEVRDRKLDVFKNVSSKLSVTASIQNGWYILKSQNGTADFDYRGLDGLYIDDVMRTIVGNEALQGDALKLLFQPKGYNTEGENESGTPVILKNQKAIHILSSKEFKTIDAARFTLFKGYDDQFYSPPVVRKPCGIFHNNDYTFYIDNHLLYSSGLGGVGKFGTPFYYDDFHTDYEIFPSLLQRKNKAIVFDKKSRTFYSAAYDPYNLQLSRFQNSSDGASLTNMNMELKGLLQRSAPDAYAPYGYALMHKTGTEEYALYTIKITGFTSYPVTNINPVPESAEMPEATAFGTHRIADCLYFSSGNKLNIYTNSSAENRESLLKSFPSDEEIAFIHHFVAVIPDSEKPVNTLVVATNNEKGWKIYFFALLQDTPEINTEPEIVLEGAGKVAQVLYFNSAHK